MEEGILPCREFPERSRRLERSTMTLLGLIGPENMLFRMRVSRLEQSGSRPSNWFLERSSALT